MRRRWRPPLPDVRRARLQARAVNAASQQAASAQSVAATIVADGDLTERNALLREKLDLIDDRLSALEEP